MDKASVRFCSSALSSSVTPRSDWRASPSFNKFWKNSMQQLKRRRQKSCDVAKPAMSPLMALMKRSRAGTSSITELVCEQLLWAGGGKIWPVDILPWRTWAFLAENTEKKHFLSFKCYIFIRSYQLVYKCKQTRVQDIFKLILVANCTLYMYLERSICSKAIFLIKWG